MKKKSKKSKFQLVSADFRFRAEEKKVTSRPWHCQQHQCKIGYKIAPRKHTELDRIRARGGGPR
jgi:hypothetical protein